MPSTGEALRGLPGLRSFALALARDDRFVTDQLSAERLVDRLLRRATMEAVAGGPAATAAPDPRLRAFGQFLRLYRRHVRKLAAEDADYAWDERTNAVRTPAAGISMAAAIRMLPLDLREALLIVVLGRFTHEEAASALDIPLAALLGRLLRARERLAALTGRGVEIETAASASAVVAHLRVVK